MTFTIYGNVYKFHWHVHFAGKMVIVCHTILGEESYSVYSPEARVLPTTRDEAMTMLRAYRWEPAEGSWKNDEPTKAVVNFLSSVSAITTIDWDYAGKGKMIAEDLLEYRDGIVVDVVLRTLHLTKPLALKHFKVNDIENTRAYFAAHEGEEEKWY